MKGRRSWIGRCRLSEGAVGAWVDLAFLHVLKSSSVVSNARLAAPFVVPLASGAEEDGGTAPGMRIAGAGAGGAGPGAGIEGAGVGAGKVKLMTRPACHACARALGVCGTGSGAAVWAGAGAGCAPGPGVGSTDSAGVSAGRAGGKVRVPRAVCHACARALGVCSTDSGAAVWAGIG